MRKNKRPRKSGGANPPKIGGPPDCLGLLSSAAYSGERIPATVRIGKTVMPVAIRVNGQVRKVNHTLGQQTVTFDCEFSPIFVIDPPKEREGHGVDIQG